VPIALVSGCAAWNYVVALVLVIGLSYALISRKVVVGTDFVAIRKFGPYRVAQADAIRSGALKQTQRGGVLTLETANLWQAVVSGDPADTLPAFFPLAAYRQVKTVPAPATDWGDRLLGGFALDIRTAHDLLGPAAADATLIRVEVPAGHVSWVRPGSCANRVGYWHVAGARVLTGPVVRCGRSALSR